MTTDLVVPRMTGYLVVMDIPDYRDPSRQEIARLANAITEAIEEISDVDVDGAIDPPGSSPRKALAALHVLQWAREALDGLESASALTAGDAGASYADLGSAVGITRQAARTRWPGAVPDARPGRPRKSSVAEEERRERTLVAALSAWPELVDPLDVPCEAWWPASSDPQERSTGDGEWIPGVVTERCGPEEWRVEIDGAEGVFRDLSEIRRPQ